MTLADVDERAKTITVRLKGARDEHCVPITDDFWLLLQNYLSYERTADPQVSALWTGLRKGKGKPLSYASFESALRYLGRKLGANVNAHLFRHTVAQALVDHGSLKVAQEILGHQHISTTADIYVRVDHQAMVEALTTVKAQGEQAVGRQAVQHQEHGHDLGSAHGSTPRQRQYAFAYDQRTLDELDQAATGVHTQHGGTHE